MLKNVPTHISQSGKNKCDNDYFFSVYDNICKGLTVI